MIRVAIGLLILILFELSCIVSPAQTIVTIAGTGEYGFNGDSIIATNAQIGDVPRFCVDNCGNIYFSDGYIVREVDANSGLITRYAGIGSSGFSGDGGTALDAQFNSPTETAVDQFNNVYVGDALNYRIRKVNALTNIITTYAGNGIHSGSGIDGIQATSSAIYTGDFAFDRSGNMFLCDSNRIRKVDTAGIITTVAGTGDTGYTFSNIPATLANFSCWPAINTDYVGNFYFVDGKGSVQKVNVSTGLISRVAGSGIGVGSYLGDGIQATACFMNPSGICFDSIGNMFISCYTNQICIKVDTNGFTHTIAGTGVAGFSGDNGDATAAKLRYPKDVKMDRCGNLYIADWENYRIRKITYNSTCTLCDTTRPAAVNNIIIASGLNIYPNPAQSILEIEAPEDIKAINIYDAIGREQLKLNAAGKHATIDIKSLRAGIYFVCVNGEEWRRFLKE